MYCKQSLGKSLILFSGSACGLPIPMVETLPALVQATAIEIGQTQREEDEEEVKRKSQQLISSFLVIAACMYTDTVPCEAILIFPPTLFIWLCNLIMYVSAFRI